MEQGFHPRDLLLQLSLVGEDALGNPKPRQKRHRIEWLHQLIVRTSVQTADNLLLVTLGAEEQNVSALPPAK